MNNCLPALLFQVRVLQQFFKPYLRCRHTFFCLKYYLQSSQEFHPPTKFLVPKGRFLWTGGSQTKNLKDEVWTIHSGCSLLEAIFFCLLVFNELGQGKGHFSLALLWLVIKPRTESGNETKRNETKCALTHATHVFLSGSVSVMSLSKLCVSDSSDDSYLERLVAQVKRKRARRRLFRGEPCPRMSVSLHRVHVWVSVVRVLTFA